MASSEVMTSSTHSFAYSYRLVKKCFVKICETSKCHNFLIFQPIFIRFSLLCLKNFTLSSEIKLIMLWSSSLTLPLTEQLGGVNKLWWKLQIIYSIWCLHFIVSTQDCIDYMCNTKTLGITVRGVTWLGPCDGQQTGVPCRSACLARHPRGTSPVLARFTRPPNLSSFVLNFIPNSGRLDAGKR